jgi:hypothetical protein
MRRFLIKSCIFLIPVIGFFLLLDNRLFSIPNSYNSKRINLERISANVNIIVTGSSQSLFGINPSYFDLSGFNVANSSQSLYYDKEIVIKNLNKLSNLKCVIIPISYFSLYYRLEDSEEAWRSYYYYQYWGIDNSNMSKFDIRKYSAFALYTPSVSASIISNNFNTNFTDGIQENGYNIRDTSGNFANISFESGKKRVAFHQQLIDKGDYQQVSSACDELIKVLINKGLKVVIITPPVYKTYSSFLDSGILKKNKNFINRFSLNPNVVYYDFLTDPRFEKRDFLDNDHLNFIGAEKFSKIINEEIISKIGINK